MDETTAKIMTICECIDHCFSFEIWCREFAGDVDPEDMMVGLDRGHQLVSDATRLLSFMALRKVDDFLRDTRPQKDDLIAADLGLDPTTIVETVGGRFLSDAERTSINKQAAHLTQRLTFDADSESDLRAILSRSMPLFERLVAELRGCDGTGDAACWLDRTNALIGSVEEGG